MTRTLLFVEDDTDLREAFADLLEFAGWTVIQAADGLEALAWLEANGPPALILLDLKMPRCDGYRFREQQLADPRWRNVPTVIFTADANMDELQLSALGDVPVARKSIDFADLRALLDRLAARPQ